MTLTPTGYTKTKTVVRGGMTKVKTKTYTERPLPSMKLFDKKVTKVKIKSK